MSEFESNADEALILRLSAGLRPVHRLLPPTSRAALWLACAVLVGLAAIYLAGYPSGALDRLTSVPDVTLAFAGSVGTAILAALAAFHLAVPDRSRFWLLAPLPGLAVWLAGSGMGCLRHWIAPGMTVADSGESIDCLRFIVMLSAPLSLVLIFLLRRAAPLRPRETAVMAGLAASAASASALALIHAFDAAATDLAFHLVGIVTVIVVSLFAGAPVLARPAEGSADGF